LHSSRISIPLASSAHTCVGLRYAADEQYDMGSSPVA
jgi:hypothetical protein